MPIQLLRYLEESHFICDTRKPLSSPPLPYLKQVEALSQSGQWYCFSLESILALTSCSQVSVSADLAPCLLPWQSPVLLWVPMSNAVTCRPHPASGGARYTQLAPTLNGQTGSWLEEGPFVCPHTLVTTQGDMQRIKASKEGKADIPGRQCATPGPWSKTSWTCT